MNRNPTLILLACAALLLPAATTATANPYQQVCPAGGTTPPCVTVTLVEKVADLVSVTAGLGPTIATVQVQTGDLVVMAGSLQVFRGTIAFAQANGLPDASVLAQNLTVATTSFESQATQTLGMVPSGTAGLGPVVGAVWLATLDVRVTASVHESVLVPIVVPA